MVGILHNASFHAVAALCSGQVMLGPMNTAVARGNDARLNCSANIPNDDFLEWRHLLEPNKPAGTRIWYSKDGHQGDPRYSVQGFFNQNSETEKLNSMHHSDHHHVDSLDGISSIYHGLSSGG